jgi:hypothetical protein
MKVVFYLNDEPLNETAGISNEMGLEKIRDAAIENFKKEISENKNPNAWIKISIDKEMKSEIIQVRY